MTAGHRLRARREQLGLTLREVENASERIAQRHRDDEYAILLSRLSDFETKGVIPSVQRIYSLAVIYRMDFRELLMWFGVDLNDMVGDLKATEPPRRTHVAQALSYLRSVEVPVRLDPGFDLRRTTNLGRMIERWGVVPLACLQQLSPTSFTYGYIGMEDFTMYPLLMPGSFVQVDEERSKVVEKMWRSEYERPIYFVETREGYTCCWCAIQGTHLLLQPHPLSPVQARTVRHPQEAEVIGQVVGVAMRLGDCQPATQEKGARNLRERN